MGQGSEDRKAEEPTRLCVEAAMWASHSGHSPHPPDQDACNQVLFPGQLKVLCVRLCAE